MECFNGAYVGIRRADAPVVRTTDGAIALLNIRAQIDGWSGKLPLPVSRRSGVVI